MKKDLFKPRDFIYMNTSKLDSYFSQLFGGLIQNVNTSNENKDGSQRLISLDVDAALKFGLGEGSAKLLDFIIGQIGNINLGGKAGFNVDLFKTNQESNHSSTNKTLEHFQYTLFEESMEDLGYLIDLDKFLATHSSIDSGQVRENLSSSDFVKYTASNVSISDYRNASEFVKLIKRVIELAIEFNENSPDDSIGLDNTELRRKSTAKIANLFLEKQIEDPGISNKFNTIVEAIYEFFNGDMIPHNILLTSDIEMGKQGRLTFESQLQDIFLLEDRTELSYTYGFFEDTEWTVIGQITSIDNVKSPNFDEVVVQAGQRIQDIFANHDSVNINSTVKEIVKEIDELSKKVGLLPLVEEHNIAITPIAIYREPYKNNFFKGV